MKKRLDIARNTINSVPSEEFEDSLVRILTHLVEELDNPGVELGMMAAFDPDATCRRRACRMIEFATQDPLVPESVRENVSSFTGQTLVQLMHDSQVPDDRKFFIAPLLSFCGVDLDEADYSSCFEDLEGTSLRMSREAFESLAVSPQMVEEQLMAFGLIQPEHRRDLTREHAERVLQFLRRVTEVNPPLGSWTLCTFAALAQSHAGAHTACAEALQLASETDDELTCWALQEYGRWPGTGLLGELARSLAQRMEARGVTARRPCAGSFSHGLVSNLDGADSSTMLMFFDEGVEKNCYAFLLNADRGVKDVYGMFGDAESRCNEKMASCPQVRWAPCGLELARRLVGDAFHAHARNGTNVPGLLLAYCHALGDGEVAPEAYEPDLSAYNLKRIKLSPKLIENSEKLLENSLYSHLAFTHKQAYNFVSRRLRRGRRNTYDARLSDADFKEFVDKIAAKKRSVLERRLARNLEIEAMAGRSRKAANRMAARLLVALRNDVKPFGEIPYVRHLCRRAADAITDNIHHGFRSQEEANEAFLDLQMHWAEEWPDAADRHDPQGGDTPLGDDADGSLDSEDR